MWYLKHSVTIFVCWSCSPKIGRSEFSNLHNFVKFFVWKCIRHRLIGYWGSSKYSDLSRVSDLGRRDLIMVCISALNIYDLCKEDKKIAHLTLNNFHIVIIIFTRKYSLRGYILGVLAHTTAWDWLWGSDVFKIVDCMYVAWLRLAWQRSDRAFGTLTMWF